MADRKRRDPFDVFRDFDEMFDEMFREMQMGAPDEARQGGPFFYGFS